MNAVARLKKFGPPGARGLVRGMWVETEVSGKRATCIYLGVDLVNRDDSWVQPVTEQGNNAGDPVTVKTPTVKQAHIRAIPRRRLQGVSNEALRLLGYPE